MSTDQEAATINEVKPKFSKNYIGIFSAYYFIEGLSISMLSVIVPIYILTTATGSINNADIASLGSITVIPWAIKFIYGIFGDKMVSKKMGRRKPWIVFPGIFVGLVWLLLPLLLNGETNPDKLFSIFKIAGIIGGFGFAIGDTSIDGLVLDITPPKQLGRVQGFCWGFRSVGNVAGGSIIALVVIAVGFNPVYSFMIFGICTFLFSLMVLFIKEGKAPESVDVKKNLKDMFTKGRNWKVYIWSIVHTLTEGVFLIFLSLFILVQMGQINASEASLEALDGNYDLYKPQAIVSLLTGSGIVIGALLGGKISDTKSRQLSSYISYILSFVSCVLLLISFESGSFNTVYLAIVAVLCGAGLGWRNSSYTSVLGQYSKEYPEMDGTYFSLGSSFCNIGMLIGLNVVEGLFVYLGNQALNFSQVYNWVWIVIAGMLALAPASFAILKKKDYEIKK